MSQPLSEVRPARVAWADALKVWLVVGVIVAHAVMAWTELEAWVLEEPPVREPLLTTLRLVALVGSLFGIAVFFLVAGVFTPRSLARKGPRRYAQDRLLRLGVPLVTYLLLMAPVVEFVDVQDNAGWDRSFLAFVPHSWAYHAPGPLWFLEGLLLFSLGYALVRTLRPARPVAPAPLRPRVLVAAGGGGRRVLRSRSVAGAVPRRAAHRVTGSRHFPVARSWCPSQATEGPGAVIPLA